MKDTHRIALKRLGIWEGLQTWVWISKKGNALYSGCEEENVNHILIHCIVVRALWDIVLGLVDVKKGLEIHSAVYFLDGMEGEE